MLIFIGWPQCRKSRQQCSTTNFIFFRGVLSLKWVRDQLFVTKRGSWVYSYKILIFLAIIMLLIHFLWTKLRVLPGFVAQICRLGNMAGNHGGLLGHGNSRNQYGHDMVFSLIFENARSKLSSDVCHTLQQIFGVCRIFHQRWRI